MASTLTEYLASQEHLVREAALALPHQFSQCTYSLGSLRQAVYLCVTCPESRGLCSACSVACHTDHEQIELFPKRNFRCDCPTTSIAHPCTLNTTLKDENTTNVYGQNFEGKFCRCGRPYDAKTERETMIQCLACEDWFHESCCNLRQRPTSREPTPQPEQSETPVNGEDNEDAVSEASSSGLPPPLISASEYESFICGSCVSNIETLKKWAGTRGAMMVVRNSTTEPWRCLNGDTQHPEELVTVDDSSTTLTSGAKRPLSPSLAQEPDAKRARGTSSSSATSPPSNACIAPPRNPYAQKLFEDGISFDLDYSLGTGDVFLTDGFRERWCRCHSCFPSLETKSYLLEEEDTYEPPDDPDSGLSLEELGMRALERLPRDRAIDGIHAFNEMRDGLKSFLRPFAQDGKVVNESDVREFFESLKEAAKKGQ
ncbi:uncharacterized protein LACBIDRAFT_318396 [Laccaria bicolor S238N-H82]|uniref:Predicted protein n=1 Tax=Laccaria bicolor (strain S238N-H82 / ATCC MYA-4686) TaxID=486041 RepID=B0D6M9_LACBS|nr:uncharacterized protein LACBIDRAFT_318396 [Laccaria bicolor S238N-H82]EDR09981.1 predicted protein [Laccaria bicolor S238N-H82]|eukprot:XP_001879366.1 predicted protein [Laccaria bicolor S238N-H82]